MEEAKRPSPSSAPVPHVDPLEVDAAMIRGLYQRVRPLILANFGALILLTFALWDDTERLPLVLWALTLASWTMLRFVLARVYMRCARPLEETWRWTLAFACGSTVAGCLWGSSVLFVGDLDSDNAKLVTAFLMAALSAAAIAGYTNSLLAFVGFVGPALLPYGWRLINLGGTPNFVVVAFVIFWGVLLWIMVRHLNEGFRESIALSFRNRNLAEQWRMERDRAEAASQAKSRFLGHMSHELRTPLNAVIGYADMIAQKMLGPLGNDAYEGYARDIADSGRHMLSMVDGILDLSAAESDGLDLAAGPTELDVILASTVASLKERAAEKEISLSMATAKDLPAVSGDAERLLQLLFILLDNAIKFTPRAGDVRVDLRLAGDEWIELEISDTGIGMDPELIEAVGQPFKLIEEEDHLRRSSGDVAARHTSPRLNLPLARLLAEAHGGSLAIASEPGSGTTVTLRFPVASQAADLPGKERGASSQAAPAKAGDSRSTAAQSAARPALAGGD